MSEYGALCQVPSGDSGGAEQDRMRFDPLIGVQIPGLQQPFRLAAEGSLSPEVWADMQHAQRWLGQQAGVSEWWAQWQHLYRRDFQEFYEGLIREGEAAG